MCNYAESTGQLEMAEAEGESLELQALETFTNYSVTVSAFTRAGGGAASGQVFCSTDEDGGGRRHHLLCFLPICKEKKLIMVLPSPFLQSLLLPRTSRR